MKKNDFTIKKCLANHVLTGTHEKNDRYAWQTMYSQEHMKRMIDMFGRAGIHRNT